MEIVTIASRMRELAHAARAAGRRTGFVPTMGALHDGHLALVRRAASECDRVVLSIYVNPLQFGPGEDFDGYPRDRERDTALARAAGVTVLFVPAEGEVHRPGHRTFVAVERMPDVLCGRSRPGHFRGVTTVVHKLLAIVRPEAAYFGEKDAQQLRVIRRMAYDLHAAAEIVGCPTVREPDGLALSSRNLYLPAPERRAAPVLFRALREAAAAAARGERDIGALVGVARARIESEPLARIDYVEAVDDEELTPVAALERPVLLAVAVWFGAARLIDNIVLQPPR
jgi:pantoate--beta-alanine ligase